MPIFDDHETTPAQLRSEQRLLRNHRIKEFICDWWWVPAGGLILAAFWAIAWTAAKA